MPISLKAITLCNLKSFRGEIIINNIQSFTAIIGPNGSGKSNIMDAVDFVLGAELNTLRVKDLNELIHEAFIGKPVVEDTYVTIILLTGNQNQERSYTRMIQGKASQYKIDDKIVTRDFYMTELKEYNLDIKAGNFLIPQGYIQYFGTINMPKELSMMFEEISGSNVYKAEYERLQLKLLKVNREMHFAYQTKKEQLTRKKSAILEKTEAEKYLQLQEQYMKEKLKLQLIQLIFIDKQIKFLQNEQKKIKLHIDEHLQDKEIEMTLLNRTKLKIKPLSDSLNKTEESILQLEENILKKKREQINLANHIAYWQKKHDCARTSLDSANKARNIHEKTVQELQNELKTTEKLADELFTIASREDDIAELHNSQVNRYMILKTKVEGQAKDFVTCINNLIHEQQIAQYKLDNKNRSKKKLETKVKLTETLIKEQFEIKVQKLKTLSDLFKSRLMEKEVEKQKLMRKIEETQEKSLKLKNDITKIAEELAEADINNDIISQQKKRSEMIKNLKELFPGVHDRLSNLCKPILSYYNVAVTKVFGVNMDAIIVDTEHIAKQCIYFLKQRKIGVERFLPLDSIKVKPIDTRLRAELQQTSCKLLYDVVQSSSMQIDKAVLYVAENTIVYKTAEDARKKSFESDGKYNCVSLDGCFFHKSGTISGGLTNLIVKAKQWEKIQSLSELKEKKTQLRQELKNLAISRMESDFDIINKEINQLTAKNEIIEKNIENIIEIIQEYDIKLNDLHMQLNSKDTAISIIQHKMQERKEEINTMEKNINEIKSKIFIDFCKEVNVPDITCYEKNLCIYKERLTKKIENKNRRDYITDQLNFERERDAEFKDKIKRWKCAVEQADAEYNEACEQEKELKTAIEQKETRMSKLKNDYKIKENDLEDVKKELDQHRSKISDISKSYLENQKVYMTIKNNIEQETAKYETIFKECKLEGITIPMLSETSHEKDVNSSSSNLSAESLNVSEVIMNIDFSQISEHIHNNTTNLLNIIKQYNKKLIEIQNKLETLQKPNLKASEKLDLIVQQIKEINKKHQELRAKFNNISKKFEEVKTKRHKLFSDCLECFATEVDSIYKNLNDDMSGQAFIILENPEEPYTSNINYSCIPPSKRFPLLQYLSDGEKSIANLAFRFAILRYKPTSFFIMDEGDAALDNANINKLVRFIRSQMNNMQILVITLNKHLSSHANMLIGITTQPKRAFTESVIFAVPLLKMREK